MGKTGTKEWAKKNVNISTGCSNACLYCYGRQMKVRFGQVKEEDWPTEVIHENKINQKYGKIKNLDDSVYDAMIPTVHDVTEKTLPGVIVVLKKLLESGNSVVVVSKPRIDCIKKLCTEISEYKSQVVFRFTITAMDDNLLSYWEPGAPKFAERLEALRYAFERGFTTSVSAEPCLDLLTSPELIRTLEPYVTETLWIGKMNQVKARVRPKTDEDKKMMQAIIDGQTDDIVYKVYQSLKNHPKVRWKDSFKKTLLDKYNITA